MADQNKPAGGSLEDSFNEEDIVLPSELESLSKAELEELEELSKTCPRCGGKSANPSNKAGRCRSCLNKLKRAKKTPGHYIRAHTKADDALRRQKGKNGTASKKSSGLGSRKSIVRQIQSAEKKTGQKLSPDRKDNSKGYAASNTRAVPEHLNRGRHKVDGKKLKAWRKKMKKSEVDFEALYTLLKAKAYEAGDEGLLNLVKSLTPSTLEQYVDLVDQDY